MSPITDHQKKYINENLGKVTIGKLVRETGLTAGRIKEYCDLHGLVIPEPTKSDRMISIPSRKKYIKDNPKEIDFQQRDVKRVRGTNKYSNGTPFNIAKQFR